MRLTDLLNKIKSELEQSGSSSPLLDAQIIASHVLKVERHRIAAGLFDECSPAQEKKIINLATRREKGEPIAYITGVKEFYSIEFLVNPHVLIPRPETELLVDLAIFHAPMNGSVLDLCSGSGAIAVALKHNRADLSVSATDISPEAVKIAKKNSDRNLGAGKIKFFTGDLFAPLAEKKFDLIVTNPPYIDPAKKIFLQREIFFEPVGALFSEESGGAHLKKIIRGSSKFLKAGGMLIAEIDPALKLLCETEGEPAGFSVSVLNDYAGLARVAVFKL